MHTHTQRRLLLRGGLALAGASLLPAARACEYFSSSLRITHPWTRAAAQHVPYAVVCMRLDEVQQDDRLIGLDTPVARAAEMVGAGGASPVDLPLRRGEVLVLGEGERQLRLVGLNTALEVGRSYPMQLHFEVSGTVNASLNIDYGRFA